MIRIWVTALMLLIGGCLSAPQPAKDAEPAAPAESGALSTLPETASLSPQKAPGEPTLPQDDLGVRIDAGEAGSAPAADGGVPGEEAASASRDLDAGAVPAVEARAEEAPEPEVVFDFPVVENERVRHFVDYYTGNGRKTFLRWLERSGRYLALMRQIFHEEGVPEDLVYLAMVESGFNPRAYSWAHAAGPWQFIESTGRMFGLENTWWRDERRDFVKATRAAARFLKGLHARFDGDWYLAVAAYNAGGGKIDRAIRKCGSRDFWEISKGRYLRAETRDYVPKLLAVLLIAKQLDKYGVAEPEYHSPVVYEEVTIPTTTDLELVAELCDVSYDEIKALNPELKRWCTPPGITNYSLRVPPGSGELFARRYAQVPEGERANYLRHRIEKGDTILALAKRYDIRVDDILALNDVSNPRALRIGSDLILPLKEGYTRQPRQELQDDYVRSRRRSYTVRKGDNLWEIARRFGVTERELRVWNRLGWSNLIRPGQRLVVSSRGGAKARSVAKSGTTRKVVYQVRPGDTLWAIGRQFEVPTRDIMSWNELPENHILRPGDKLTLLLRDGNKG